MENSCIRAYHEMEERYARMVLEYANLPQRKKICDSIAETIEATGFTPQTIITPKKDGSGEYVLEFHDDYDKESGVFFEHLLKDLDITLCD